MAPNFFLSANREAGAATFEHFWSKNQIWNLIERAAQVTETLAGQIFPPSVISPLLRFCCFSLVSQPCLAASQPSSRWHDSHRSLLIISHLQLTSTEE